MQSSLVLHSPVSKRNLSTEFVFERAQGGCGSSLLGCRCKGSSTGEKGGKDGELHGDGWESCAVNMWEKQSNDLSVQPGSSDLAGCVIHWAFCNKKLRNANFKLAKMTLFEPTKNLPKTTSQHAPNRSMMSTQPRTPTTAVGGTTNDLPSKGMGKNAIPSSPTSPNRGIRTPEATAPASAPQKQQTLLLMLLLSCGIGVLGGFFAFYSMYYSQCARKLISVSSDYNTTIEKLQTVDNRKTLEKQQGMLDQQAALATQHQELLVRLADAQKEQEKSSARIEVQKKEMDTMGRALREADRSIQQAKDKASKETDRVQRQLDLARTMLQEKVEEVEELKERSYSANKCQHDPATSSNDEVVEIQSSIRRRDSIQIVSKFGHFPITVMFLVKSPNQNAVSFEMEFPHHRDMPHTIFTFLTLVDGGLFLETSLSQNGNLLSGGNPASCVRKQSQSKIVRRMAEMGLGMEPSLFTERSAGFCRAGSVGWVRRGPEFAIYLEDATEDFICPGKVTSGMDELRKFPPGDKISILDARIVYSNNDEL